MVAMDEYESVAKFYKDNTSFIEEMEEKEGQELEIAISEAKKFLVKYGLKPQQYGKCKFNNLQTRTEGVYHNGDWRKTNFILVKVFRNKIYCWFDAVKVMQSICNSEIHILTEEELKMVLGFMKSLLDWMKDIEDSLFICPAKISIIKKKIKGLFYTKSGKLKKGISTSSIITMLYEMLMFKSLNKQYKIL